MSEPTQDKHDTICDQCGDYWDIELLAYGDDGSYCPRCESRANAEAVARMLEALKEIAEFDHSRTCETVDSDIGFSGPCDCPRSIARAAIAEAEGSDE